MEKDRLTKLTDSSNQKASKKRPLETPSSPGKQKIPRLEFPATASLEEKEEFVLKNRGETPMLLFASEVGDLEICRHFVGKGTHVVGTVDEKGSNVFHYAARNATHGLELLEYFESLGEDIERRNDDGEQAVKVAVKEGNFDFAITLYNKRLRDMSFLSYCIGKAIGLDILKSLYEKNASLVNVENKFDLKYLIPVTAAFGDLDIMKWVIEICRSSLENHVDVRNEVLYYGIKACGDNMKHGEQIVSFLMDEYSLQLLPRDLESPLKYAFVKGNIPVADYLMKKHGACIPDKKSFLEELICNEFVKAEIIGDFLNLVEKKVDDILTYPLHFASQYSRPEVCEWMVRQGLDVAAVVKESLCTVLHFAVLNESHGLAHIRFFAQKMSANDVNRKDSQGQTALHVALGNARLDAAEELIKYGADLDVEFKKCNLLLYCVGKNQFPSAKFVYGKKKSLVEGLGPEGKVALHIATEFENKPMIQWLNKIVNDTLNSRIRDIFLNNIHSL
ncbi:putative ankyrin repeat protein RF_0381 [Cloeon dipterum]|uniref:putative ankyrin repeat protein RF_0381 n=1 Tax=Cloeon dipterum TaxID=197152 RepID=UPI00321FE898